MDPNRSNNTDHCIHNYSGVRIVLSSVLHVSSDSAADAATNKVKRERETMKIIGRQKSLKDSTVKFIIELNDRERKRKAIVYEKVFYQRNVDLEIDPECYECTSHCLGTGGYPVVKVEGKQYNLHRYIYIQIKKETPDCVMHLCDNRRCINIRHLKGGTKKENTLDRIYKGRCRGGSTKGESNPSHTLKEEDVSVIKKLLLNGFSQRKVAVAYGVSKSLIGKISIGELWKEVQP